MKVTKLIICLIVLSMIVMVPVIAEGPTDKAGESHMAHLYLYERDPDTWEIVPGGRWGKMSYVWKGPNLDLVVNAHGFDPADEDDEYCLIYYPDPWPGTGLICLGEGVVEENPVLDEFGDPVDPAQYTYDLHIESKGINDVGDLPKIFDNNSEAKIWLVLSDDVDCDPVGGTSMTGWNPTDYLFDYDTIVYDAP